MYYVLLYFFYIHVANILTMFVSVNNAIIIVIQLYVNEFILYYRKIMITST